MRRFKLLIALAGVVMIVSAQAGTAKPGFRTNVPPMLTLAPAAPIGSNVKAIISSGDEFGDFEFEGIPDGIGFVDQGSTIDVYVTHEQSRVPFPATTPNSADLQDSSISLLTMNAGGKVFDAEVALPPTEGFIRFCSAFMAGVAEGFASPVFFANEESNDPLAVPASAPYGPDSFYGVPSTTRQAGYAVYLDTATGHYDVIPGMGRMNHENTVVVPGGWAGHAVALTGDDTFLAPSSQLYLYDASTTMDLVADLGHLYAFRVTGRGGVPLTDPADAFNGANDYGDIAVGQDLQGEFILVPDGIADGTDPTEGGTLPAMNPQDALERWSNNHNVFQFIRVEDIAYDRTNPRVVYFADTAGERRAVRDTRTQAQGGTGRLLRDNSANGPFPNGRIFRMEFSAASPFAVTSLTILRDDDALARSDPNAMHQPDNVETSANSLMVQEDTAPPSPRSRIWRYDFATGTWSIIAAVNGPPIATDPAWESSGIVNASSAFGPGAWLVTVQAHSILMDQVVVGGTTYKREGGQLLLIRLPGT